MTTAAHAATVERFNNLFLELEDLLRRIADTDDPEIRRKRARVRAEMVALQSDFPRLSSQHLRPIVATTTQAVAPEPMAWGPPTIATLTGVALALSVLQPH